MSEIPVVDGLALIEDAESGRLFEVPRIGVVVDTADPTVLKLAISGSVELDRGNASHVDFYNRLFVGEEDSIVVTVYAAGTKKIHRRDSEGDVDAIVETKSLVLAEVYVPEEREKEEQT